MTSLVIEQLTAPGSGREERALTRSRRRAVEELAGRTVWCMTAAPSGTSAADRLQRCLQAVVGDGVGSRRASLRLAEPLLALVERLDAMLRGARWPAASLGPAARDAYLRGSEDGEQLIPDGVHAGDVIVLHDPVAAALASPIRERGAHAVWRTSIGPWESSVAEAWRFLYERSAALDAYVSGWRSDQGGIAAFISAPGVVSAKQPAGEGPAGGYGELGWTTLLAEIVRDDRAERVGGTVRARPFIPAR